MKSPAVFLSSFYQERLYGVDRRSSPLWRLRQNVWQDHLASEFEGGSAAWVAEKSNPLLFANPDSLAVVDELVAVLLQCKTYVCILADARHDDPDHGSPIEIGSGVAATSYFEIELYAAAMYRKPIKIFLLDGFDPGKRLRSLLEILEWAYPHWNSRRRQKADEIRAEINALVRKEAPQDDNREIPLRQQLVIGLYTRRAAHASPGNEGKSVLFMNGSFERGRTLPQKDVVQELLGRCEAVAAMQQKLNRVWMAVRELMSASYLPKDVQADNRLADFLPLWNQALSLWSSAAAWSGFHGHLYAGVIAPLNSQAIIRPLVAPGERKRFPPDVWMVPYGGLASAHYSIGKLLPFGIARFVNFRRALKYIHWAMAQSKRIVGAITPGDLAVRGSIRLQLGDPFGALRDFTRMAAARSKQGAVESEMGLEFMHLGIGYAAVGRLFKARSELERSVRILLSASGNPNLPRAERHLGVVYSLIGKKTKAAEMKARARQHATEIGAMDQYR